MTAETSVASPEPASEAEARLHARLAEIVGLPSVLTSLPDHIAYSRDCWPEGIILTRGGKILRHRASCVVLPANEAEVVEVIRACFDARVPVVPYGAGSGVCGGTVPSRGGVIVDVKKLRAIEMIDESAGLIRVGAGIIGMDLETELLRRGLTLGHYPSSLYCSSLGGYLAGRSAGQQSSKFGKIEDMAQSVRVVTGAAEVLDTAPGPGADKWQGGLDTTQLVVGSEGTLGVITSAVLRLMVKPERQLYRGFRCPSIEEGLEAQRLIMQAGIRPCIMRLYDEFDTLIAGQGAADLHKMPRLPGGAGFDRRTDEDAVLPDRLMVGLLGAARSALPQDTGWMGDLLPDLSARLKRAARGLLGRAIGQPLLLNQLTDALPGGALLVVGFEGAEEHVEREALAAFAILREHGYDLGRRPGHHWLKNRFNISYKQSPMFDAGAFVDTMEVATTWGKISDLYYAVKEAVAPHVFIMAHFSHAYPEGASIYFTFAGFGKDLEESLANYRGAWAAAQDAVVATGATISHHHGVGESKASRTHLDHVGGRPLFDAVKAAFDPRRIMNPGKVWTQPDNTL
jgi:alkyldihydroxyacetonephosphate synthase